LASRLGELVQRDPSIAPTAFGEDLARGLGVITSRAEALTRFLAAYTQLARLPAPRMHPVKVSEWVARVARLEPRVKVQVAPGPDVTIQADGDQLDQVLINLVKNAADAVQGTEGGVRMRWSVTDGRLSVVVEDDGPGIGQTANLFVPFYTTKVGGTGVGLVLSRQIAESHGGSLVLANRAGASAGCEVRLELPLSRS
ncbi:MAG: ATP-binding protein, partial [Gemmatimonadota bacterium]|nr:ATP-binding protein [Gemmatimonadota bacterium]